MIQRGLADAAQLTNRGNIRSRLFYGYLIVVAVATAVIDSASRASITEHMDSLFLVLYLIVGAGALGRASVQIERGYLTLSGLAMGPAILLLNPIDATLVGLSLGIVTGPSNKWRILSNGIVSAAYASFGAALRTYWFGWGSLPVGTRLLVLVLVELTSWILLAVGISAYRGETIRSVVRHNFTTSFYAAYGYFTLGSVLISYLLDESLRGYFLASIVWVLALALTDTIAGRRVRRVLESELSDADRHLFHSRAVEGVVHNLRNHIATTVGYLKEIDLNRLDPVDREAVDTAAAAANDAAAALRGLAQGATPRVAFAKEPVDLNELATTAVGMARPRAKVKQIELGLRESPEEVKVKADPLLLREVMTNLVNNAIDAAPVGGHVNVSTGRRGGTSTFFTVTDDGPGVADENRHRLFEPHFTTKETGTGIGLFMSYGVIREHRGQLLYEGSRRGAVFTVVLPSYAG
jgi:signal transduction histidine kinase